MRILLADDQHDVRSALRLLLEQGMGFCVVGEAVDAENLLIQARATLPDLVLLDWELPGPPASELLPSLLSICPYVRVVALSGRLEAKQNALDSGANSFVSKGDPPERILTVLKELGENPNQN